MTLRPLRSDCKVLDCADEVWAKGCCNKHLGNIYRYGYPVVCETVRCTRQATRTGHCNSCQRQLDKYGFINVCRVRGCDDEAVCRGWCKPHYNHWYRHRHPTIKHNPLKYMRQRRRELGLPARQRRK